MLKATRLKTEINSQWIGEEKERVRGLSVTLTDIRGFEGYYGYSQIVRFVTEDGNILKWFTGVEIPFEIGDTLTLDGTIKQLVEDKYEDDAQVTILTRCKIRGE